MPSNVKNHVSTVRGLKESPHQMALRALRSITKTMATAVQVTEVPKELLFGDKIDFHRWSLVLNDEAMKELSEQVTSGKQFFIDCNATTLHGMFQKFWDPMTCPLGILELNLSAACEITDFGITLVARTNPNLRALNIAGCVKITDIGLREVALNCVKLQYLNISSCSKIEGNGLLAVAEMCHHLSKLSMSKCTQIQNWSLQRIFRKCFRLEQVKVSHMRDITDEEIRVLSEHCPDLTTFTGIECPYLSDQCVLSLTQNCRDLDVIDLTRTDMTYRVSDVALMALGQRASSLRVLRLNNCDTLTDVGLGWLAEGCRVIETFEIYGCKKITDAGLRVIGAHCHALTELDISYAKSISDVGLSSLSRGCRALKKLRCPGAIYLSDPRLVPMATSDAKTKELVWEEHIGVMALTIHCPLLEVLDVAGCFRLNKVFQYGVATLVHLKQLYIQGCNQVVPTSLVALAAGCVLLEEINISDCGKGVNNEVLLAFSQRCPNIKQLICCRNKEVKGLGVKAIANMRALEKLDLTGCSALTDSMLVHLSQGDKVPNLTDINLSQLPKISDSILAWIAMKDHKLLSFNMKGSPVSIKALQSVQDRFQDSDIVTNETYFGFQPKFRVQDRLLINSYHRMIVGVTKVQAKLRKVRAQRRVQSMQYTNRVLYSQAMLQRIVRGFLARRRVRKLRAIQQRFEHAACVITQVFRICVAKKRVQRRRYQKYVQFLQRKATKLQLRWRCHRDKLRLRALKAEKLRQQDRRVVATIVLQSVGRMYLANKFVEKKRELIRMHQRVLHRKASLIQRCYRGYHARLITHQYKALLESLQAAREVASIAIQRAFRRHRTRIVCHARALQRHHNLRCLIRIQALMRGALARLHTMEMKYERGLIRRRWGAVKIQCMWRVYKARSIFFEMLKERAQWRARQEAAGLIITRAAKMKVAWNTFLRKRREYRQRMREEASRVLRAATKIQALIRRYLGRLIYFRKIQEKKCKWKELFDEEKQQRFFYNKQTGEIRWRIPQDLLDLIPHPVCDNCSHVEAALECRICNELFCGDCFASVHQGGRRKEHEFRALYDFYGKRLDYGDGDFPCQWPSEIIQDEIQGWMLRVAPYRQPTRVFARSGWESYELANDLLRENQVMQQKKTMLGRTLEQHRVRSSLGKDNPKVFYFNRQTFATSYVMPPEVEAELYPPQPPMNNTNSNSLTYTGHSSELMNTNAYQTSYSQQQQATFYPYGSSSDSYQQSSQDQQYSSQTGNMSVTAGPQYFQTTNAAGETQFYMMSYPGQQAQQQQPYGGDAHSQQASLSPDQAYYLQLAMGTGYSQSQSAPATAPAASYPNHHSAGLDGYNNNNYSTAGNAVNPYGSANHSQQNSNQNSNNNSRVPSANNHHHHNGHHHHNALNHGSSAQGQPPQPQYEYSDDDEEDDLPPASRNNRQHHPHNHQQNHQHNRNNHSQAQQHNQNDNSSEEEYEDEEEEEEGDSSESVVAIEEDHDYDTPPASTAKPPSRGRTHEYRSYNAADLQQQQQQEYEQQQQAAQQQQHQQQPRSILKKQSYHASVDPQFYHDLSSESASVSSLVHK